VYGAQAAAPNLIRLLRPDLFCKQAEDARLVAAFMKDENREWLAQGSKHLNCLHLLQYYMIIFFIRCSGVDQPPFDRDA
jgi:hypothetical protein